MVRSFWFVTFLFLFSNVSGQGHDYGLFRQVPFQYDSIQNARRLYLIGDDNTFGPFPIGFTFCFFRASYDSFYVSTNGEVTFVKPTPAQAPAPPIYSRRILPDTIARRAVIYFLKSDFYPVFPISKLYLETKGLAPNRKLIITVDSVVQFLCEDRYNFFQVVLEENDGSVRFNILKKDTCSSWIHAHHATIGMQDYSRTIAAVDTHYMDKPLKLDSISFLFSRDSLPDLINPLADSLVCSTGDSIRLSVNTMVGGGSCLWQWQVLNWRINGIVIPFSNDSVLFARSAGEYDVLLGNGNSTIASKPVNIYNPEYMNFTLVGPDQIGPTLSYTYTTNPGNGLSYHWICEGCSLLSAQGFPMMSVVWPNYVLNPEIQVLVSDGTCYEIFRKQLWFFPLSTSKEQISEIKIYPNPNTGDFTIETLSQLKAEKLKIIDPTGRVIPFDFIQINQNEVQLSLRRRVKGLYFLELNFTEGIRKTRFIVH